jgi:hypothetical protein
MRTLTLALLVFFTGFPAVAQIDRANLNGVLTDPAGARIAGAKVEIEAKDTGLRRTTESNESGVYTFTGLPVGVYQLTATAEGFQTAIASDVTLFVGQTRTLNLQMVVGTVATSVEVVAEATAIDQSNAEIGSVVAEQQIQGIPLNGRAWSSLMLLAPGAVNTGDGTQNTIRFFGRGRDENNWTYDGTDATGVKDPRQEGNLRLVISLDSIQEFRVSSSMYSAEGGGGGGALINLVSKSGTNEFHGSAFWFVRNSYFDARRVFDGPAPPPFRLNQYGANLGGPIKKNRAFFFLNYEGLRQRLATTAAAGLVPSQAFRAQVAAQTPALRPILDAYPVGNGGPVNANTDRFTGVFPQKWDEDSGMARFDYRFSDSTLLFGRFNTVQGFVNELRTALLEPRESDVRPTQGTLALQKVFGTNIINEVKVGFNRSALTRTARGRLPERIDIPGFTSTQSLQENREVPTSYSLLDNYTRIVGRHTIKTGFEFRRIHNNVSDQGATRLTYGSLNNFIANRLDSLTVSGRFPMLGNRRTYWFAYVQDDWKVNPELTVNLGLRYENYGMSKEVNGRARVFDVDRCAGFCPQGEPWYFPDDNNFAPRASLAYAPNAFQGRTVFRVGGGLFYTPGQVDDVTAAMDSMAESFSLTIADQPALSYPVDPFLPQARSTGLQPRALQRDRRDAYTTSWTFSIQQQLPGSFVGQVAYVGNKGTHLFGRDRVNNLDPVSRLRPLPNFNSVDRKVNYNRSTFHGLQAGLNRNFTRNLLFQAQYLYGKVIDDNAGSGEGSEIQDSLCRRCERGVASFDVRQTVTVNSIYELPWARNRVWGGWSISGFFFSRTGLAVNPLINRSAANTPNGSTVNLRPDATGLNPTPATQIPDRWVSPEAFAVPANRVWGNAGRNSLRGPGLWQIDAALIKNTRFTESVNLDFRFEVFNLANRAQLGNPQNNLSTADFGVIRTTANPGATGQGTSRQLQFALRLNF